MAKAPVESDKQPDLIDQIDEQNPELEAQDSEIDVEIEDEGKKPDEAAVLLQQQIDALKKSEEIHKTRADKALREADEYRRAAEASKVEIGRTRKDAIQSQFDSVATAIAASNNEVESAKRDIKTALANQDFDAQTDALDRLAVARANLSRLEESKYDLEAKLKEPDPQPQPEQVRMPERVQRWIDDHQHLMRDPDKLADLQYLHRKAMRQGIKLDSDEYLEFIEVGAGLKQPEEKVDTKKKEEAEVPDKKVPVSAPVSRETTTNSGGGVIRLSAAQREAARVAGVSEKVYAENLVKINQMKANGSYGG